MTQEEIEAKQKEVAVAKAKKIKERKSAEIKEGFLNPFNELTSYAEFLEQVEKSKKTVSEYCEGKISEDELNWLIIELSHFENNKNN